ncbi:hypothetical protein J5J83_07095 [Azoarcus sp. L1K30]|uniref:hypothetical protein n=1 Tax=Azoarcus sp. L1K30 TaxID=2820277 RepID=UPI001B81DC24|nr:hypothetical protein [Azoarcus sp. L1K30]MBR0565877.1 hypothetical protein [Azoarcus sp. L1K30]
MNPEMLPVGQADRFGIRIKIAVRQYASAIDDCNLKADVRIETALLFKHISIKVFAPDNRHIVPQRKQGKIERSSRRLNVLGEGQ